MAEINLKVNVPEEFKEEFELVLSEVTKQFIKNLEISMLQKRIKSDEEQKLNNWSVKLGRKAKKNSFNDLISNLSEKDKREIFS